jgi:hypothetical protein
VHSLDHVIFENRSLLKIAPYTSNIKGIFRLQTIMRYVAISAHGQYTRINALCKKLIPANLNKQIIFKIGQTK